MDVVPVGVHDVSIPAETPLASFTHLTLGAGLWGSWCTGHVLGDLCGFKGISWGFYREIGGFPEEGYPQSSSILDHL